MLLGPVINRIDTLSYFCNIHLRIGKINGLLMRRYGLKDEQCDRIKNILSGREGTGGANAKDNRLFIEAVLYRYRAGIPWRDLPARFGDFRVVHLRHIRWSENGVWNMICKALAMDADNEYAMIDSTIIRAHQHSSGAKKKSRMIIRPLAGAQEA